MLILAQTPYYMTIRFLTCVLLLGLLACGTQKEQPKGEVLKITGRTQGTTYTIQYIDSANRNIQEVVDSILQEIDLSVSTYNPSSILSKLNRADSCLLINDHVLDLFLMSDEIYQNSNGAFDPTVKPLASLWGFGDAPFNADTLFTEVENVLKRDSLIAAHRDSLIKEVLGVIGWELVLLDGDILYNKLEDMNNKALKDNFLCKEDPQVQLTFDAIAQGYSADVIGSFLQYKLGINDFLIEIGGEILAQGCKPDNKSWTVSIENPDVNNPSAPAGIAMVSMTKFRALAVSGNYRNYKEFMGEKYGHIIDPRTGKPSKSKIVSAAVFADDCAIADAYATAFMIMGIDEAVPFVEGNPFEGVEAFFIYYTEEGSLETYVSTGLENFIEN